MKQLTKVAPMHGEAVTCIFRKMKLSPHFHQSPSLSKTWQIFIDNKALVFCPEHDKYNTKEQGP